MAFGCLENPSSQLVKQISKAKPIHPTNSVMLWNLEDSSHSLFLHPTDTGIETYSQRTHTDRAETPGQASSHGL